MTNTIPEGLKKACNKDWIRVIAVFLLFFGAFSAVYFPIDRLISLDDQLFHIRFAELLKERGFGIFKDFHWLYFSRISAGQHFIYYNFLFYLFLIPFTYLPSLIIGTKLASVLLASVTLAGFYFFLLASKEKKPFLWTIILASVTSFPMLSRFLNTRPYVLTPLLVLLVVLLAYRRKYLGLFLLSAFYFYWHTATFYFPLIAAGTFFMFRAFYEKRNDWKLVWSALSGTLAAFAGSLVFAPGVWPYMKIIIGIYSDTVLGKKVELAEGSELYPANFFDFAKGNALIFALLVLAIAFEIGLYIARKNGSAEREGLAVEDQGKEALRGTLFFLSLLFFAGTFLSQRNSDFFVLVSGAYLAMACNLIFRSVGFGSRLVRKTLAVGGVVVLVYFFSANLLFINDMIASAEPYQSMEGAGTWLKKNAGKGEIVFNASWNWFTRLFYYDSDNYYIAGLEPRYLYDYDSRLYWEWWHISNDGYVCSDEECDRQEKEKKAAYANEDSKNRWLESNGEEIAECVRNDFGSRLIVTSSALSALDDVLAGSDRFSKAYSDEISSQYSVYEIR